MIEKANRLLISIMDHLLHIITTYSSGKTGRHLHVSLWHLTLPLCLRVLLFVSVFLAVCRMLMADEGLALRCCFRKASRLPDLLGHTV